MKKMVLLIVFMLPLLIATPVKAEESILDLKIDNVRLAIKNIDLEMKYMQEHAVNIQARRSRLVNDLMELQAQRKAEEEAAANQKESENADIERN
jgi:hypothetical protein